MIRDRGRDIYRWVLAPPPPGAARGLGPDSRGPGAGDGGDPWPRGAASSCPSCPPSCHGWGWAGRLCSSCLDWSVSAQDWLWAGRGGCGEASCWSLCQAAQAGQVVSSGWLSSSHSAQAARAAHQAGPPLTFHFLAGDRRGLGPPPTCPLGSDPHSENSFRITC